MRRALSSAALAALTLAAAGAVRADAPVVLALTVHVAHVAGQPVVPPAFVTERIARANEIFRPHGVSFVAKKTLRLGESHAHLEDRAGRDALGAEPSAAGTIDCFFVAALRDVDEPERVRRGVHWHSRTHAGKHFVIVSSIAGPDVLAHELGHFLGNPEHSETPGNLMSYTRAEGLPFLDEAQLVRLRRSLRGYLRSHELQAVREPKR